MHRRWVRSASGAALIVATAFPSWSQEIQLVGPLAGPPSKPRDYDEKFAYRADAVVGPARTTSLVLSGAAELGGGAALALRLPTAVTFSGPSSGPALGNFALEGFVSGQLARRTAYHGSFSVTASYAVILPTATADSARVRGAILADAAAARGNDDLALLTPQRAGAVPRLALDYESPHKRLYVSGQIKAGLLGDTTGRAEIEHLYLVIPQARVAWRFGGDDGGPLCHVLVGLRGWATYVTGERRRSYVEPELTALFGDMQLSAGAIVDTGSSLAGVRLALSGVLRGPSITYRAPRAVDLRP